MRLGKTQNQLWSTWKFLDLYFVHVADIKTEIERKYSNWNSNGR